MDVLIEDNHYGFKSTGLTKSSLVRLGMLNTISKSLIKGKIGELPTGMIGEVRSRLIAFLKE